MPKVASVSAKDRAALQVWAELDVPVIAAVQGVCFGAGLQLALGADFRVAAPEARFSVMEARWGLIPDMGISQSLPRLMRADQAKELILSARVVEAPESLALGLVTRLADDPLAEARAMAARFAAVSPDVLRAGKRLVEGCWTLPPGPGLRREAELQAGLIGGPNQIEAVMAGMAGRAPKFDGQACRQGRGTPPGPPAASVGIRRPPESYARKLVTV